MSTARTSSPNPVAGAATSSTSFAGFVDAHAHALHHPHHSQHHHHHQYLHHLHSSLASSGGSGGGHVSSGGDAALATYDDVLSFEPFSDTDALDFVPMSEELEDSEPDVDHMRLHQSGGAAAVLQQQQHQQHHQQHHQPQAQQQQQPLLVFGTDEPAPSASGDSSPTVALSRLQPSSLLTHVTEQVSAKHQTLEAIFHQQRSLLPGSNELALHGQTLERLHESLALQLEADEALLAQLLAEFHLQPRDLHVLRSVREQLAIIRAQLALYRLELQFLQQPQGSSSSSSAAARPPPLAALVIVRQPFPVVVKQHKQLGRDELEVRLLLGATVRALACSPVRASIQGMPRSATAAITGTERAAGGTGASSSAATVSVASVSGSGATDKPLLNHDSHELDLGTLTAHMPLTFLEGTRKYAVQVVFSAEVTLAYPLPAPRARTAALKASQQHQQQHQQQLVVSLQSEPSRPLMVMTNQKQWEDCERYLLHREAFGDSADVSWHHFANTLQSHFLVATKQEAAQPQRPLSSFDFAYLHNQFFGNRPRVRAREFDAFWAWYGKSMQLLRYQRHIGQLWIAGLIYGYMSRDDVAAALRDQPPGTFVVRFAERHAGQFAIGYISSDGQLRHYLVKPTDTAGAKITLPDFIHSVPQFSHVHRFDPAAPLPLFARVPKDSVLESYYSRGLRGDPTGTGYDSLV